MPSLSGPPPRSATRTLLTAPRPIAEFVAQALFVFTCTGAACGQATPFSSTNPFDGSKGANSAVGVIDDGSFVPEDLPVPFVQSIAMTFGFTITALLQGHQRHAGQGGRKRAGRGPRRHRREARRGLDVPSRRRKGDRAPFPPGTVLLCRLTQCYFA